MATLGDFLGGQAETSPAEPQPGSADPGFEERKKGWMQSLQEMAQDPVTAGMMIQFGASVANPYPGENTAGTLTRAIADTMAFKGRAEQLQRSMGMEEQKAAREQQRVDLEDRRAGMAERREENRLGLDKERLGIDRERLGIDKMRAENERIRARTSGSTSTSDFRWAAGRIESEFPGISPSAAMELAREYLSKKNPEDQVNTLAGRFYESAVRNAYPGDPPPNIQEMVRAAEKIVYREGMEGEAMGTPTAKSQGPNLQENSKDNPLEITSEAEARELPKGTWVILNGRKGQIK